MGSEMCIRDRFNRRVGHARLLLPRLLQASLRVQGAGATCGCIGTGAGQGGGARHGECGRQRTWRAAGGGALVELRANGERLGIGSRSMPHGTAPHERWLLRGAISSGSPAAAYACAGSGNSFALTTVCDSASMPALGRSGGVRPKSVVTWMPLGTLAHSQSTQRPHTCSGGGVELEGH